MADTMVEATPQVTMDGGAPLGASAPPAPAPQYGNSSEQQKVMSIPTSAMKRIKDEERERGRSEGINEFLRTAGFSSPDEFAQMMSSLRSNTQQKAAPRQTYSHDEGESFPETPRAKQPTQQVAQQDEGELLAVKNARRELARYERQMEKLQRERDEAINRYRSEMSSRSQLQEALDAKEAEAALRETAVGLGVKDVDYALRLLTRELENKDESELAKFDERAFFEGLRKAKPYLFGELVQPATTGTGIGAAPAAPKPGAVTAETAKNGQTDARKMNQQEFSELLRKRGINPTM